MNLYRFFVTVQDKNGFATSKAKFITEEELKRLVPTATTSDLQNWPHIHVSVQ